MTWTERLGTVGVWRGVNDLDPAMAKTIEKVGFGTIWQGGSPGSDLRPAEELLARLRLGPPRSVVELVA